MTREGVVRAVDDVTFSMEKGDSLGLAGESGCGKSTTAYSILRIVSEPGKIVGGSIFFEGDNLLEKSEEEMRRIRGAQISIIFQEPKAAMNPLMRLGDQIAEAIRLHKGMNKREAMNETIRLLNLVGVPNAKAVSRDYAFQHGPGVIQQAMIAMALSCDAKLLIADEPTTAMDSSNEAHIITLLKELKEKLNFSMLYITHNLGNIAQICNRVAIMYGGKLVELGAMRDVFKNPIHPYTRKLLSAYPRYDVITERLPEIPGTVLSLIDPPPGCRFAERCSVCKKECEEKEPILKEVKPNHFVACFTEG